MGGRRVTRQANQGSRGSGHSYTKKDVTKLTQHLKDHSYQEIKRDDTRDWNFVMGDELGHLVDIHVIVLDSNGNGIYGPKQNGDFYPAHSLTAQGQINHQQVNCLTAEYQVQSHTGYTLKPKDHHDVKALCNALNIKLPQDYSDSAE